MPNTMPSSNTPVNTREANAQQQYACKYSMWRKLLYTGFCRFETCFGPSTQGAGTKNTSQIQILRHFERNGKLQLELEVKIDVPHSTHANADTVNAFWRPPAEASSIAISAGLQVTWAFKLV